VCVALGEEETEFKELFGAMLSDDSYVVAWTDGEFTYLTLRFVTLAIPNESFDELLEIFCNYARSKIDNSKTGVV